MALAVKWSEEARTTFEQVLDWIRNKWSEKEALNFISKTEKIVQLISLQPHLFSASKHKYIRRAIITRQTSLIYIVLNSEVYLITFWDNRKDSVKLKL